MQKKTQHITNIAALGLLSLMLYISACAPQSVEEAATKQEEEARAKLDYSLFNPIIALCKDSLTEARIKSLYATIKNPKVIENEEHAEEFFDRREKLIVNLETCFEDIIRADSSVNLFKDSIQDALATLGIRVVSVDKGILDLAGGAILQERLSNVSTPIYQYYRRLRFAEADSKGGEYPYMNLRDEMQIIEIAEKMQEKAPNNAYTREVTPSFKKALRPLTDIYLYEEPTAITCMAVAHLSRDHYPYASDIDLHKEFVRKYPNSKYAVIVSRILENTSRMNTKDTLYAIVLDTFEEAKDYDAYHHCEEKVIEYMRDKKLDVPHVIMYSKGNKNYCSAAYRFYPEKEEIEKALEKLNRPQAKIIKLNYRNHQWVQVD
ncbi:MAG: hypothetical protein JJT94_00530 [Bernardetiaceae bacterium]|nr:hypothetical protein [Bernardetiaceae bacterium]